jgi:hypothetical protein
VALKTSDPFFDSDDWLLDSGASRHITCDKSKLYDVQPLERPVLISFVVSEVDWAVFDDIMIGLLFFM